VAHPHVYSSVEQPGLGTNALSQDISSAATPFGVYSSRKPAVVVASHSESSSPNLDEPSEPGSLIIIIIRFLTLLPSRSQQPQLGRGRGLGSAGLHRMWAGCGQEGVDL